MSVFSSGRSGTGRRLLALRSARAFSGLVDGPWRGGGMALLGDPGSLPPSVLENKQPLIRAWLIVESSHTIVVSCLSFIKFSII